MSLIIELAFTKYFSRESHKIIEHCHCQPQRATMTMSNRLRLLLQVSAIVFVIICVKLVVHFLDWEVISINPLFSGIVAANVFLMGFLLSGVL